MQDYRKSAEGLIEGKTLFDASLKKFTSIRVGGPVDSLFFPKDADELRKVVRIAVENSIPWTILGKGSNLIVRDKGVRGWMISLCQGLKRIKSDGEIIEAEAGVPLQRLVQSSTLRGLAGLEPFFGIPGTVGGALAMNAGAWGVEIKDVLLSASVMRGDGVVIEKRREKLRFSYRRLALPPSWVVLKARFQLKKGDKGESLEKVKSYSEMRKRTQPLDSPSAGSIFKNPPEGPAGKWIEEAGLKGYRMGQAMVSERHANFIINLGKARAEEILNLMELIERRVYELKGISLEREVKVIGET
jgi:UDP-N-acetylmuramate dehydrogenase